MLARVGAGALGVAVAERVAVALGPLGRRGRRAAAGCRPRPAGGGRRSRTSAACRRRRAAASRAAAGARGRPSARPRSRGAPSAATVRSTWPRCRSPWMRCSGDLGRGVGERVEDARAARRRRRPSSGTIGERRVEPRVHRLRRARAGRPAVARLPKASARSACTSAAAAPSRCASPAKSPPTSSACRSASANRSRTLALASSQPSVAVVRNSCSIASAYVLAVELDRRPSRAAAAMCRAPSSVERDADLDVGVDAGLQPAEHLQDRGVAEDQRGVRLLAGQHQAGLVDRQRVGVGVAVEPQRRRRRARSRIDSSQTPVTSLSCSAS